MQKKHYPKSTVKKQWLVAALNAATWPVCITIATYKSIKSP
jgi:hypothetical protein